MQRNAGNYGFENEGNNFNEPWHKTFRGSIGGGGGGTAPGFSQAVQDRQNWLISRGYDLGPTGADGIAGPKYEAAVKAYQTYLRGRGWYSGEIDGDWGPGTQAGHDKFWTEVNNPSGHPPFPLPAGKWFGPEAGGDNSISGWHSHREDLKVFQQRMKDRGWPITVDGLYGPKGATEPTGNTADIVGQFQQEKGLVVDKLIGPSTWNTAWTAPITAPPTTPPPVTPPPVTPPVTPPAGVDEASATPDIKTPAAGDYPSWIRYEEKFDQQMMAEPLWNVKAQKYYNNTPYKPIESHVHWWGLPGQSGTHDGNTDFLNRTPDVGANFVTSAGRITLTCPLNKIALTTGQRNPYAWKSENDPNITTSSDDLGYKTLGFLHYLVEKLNPHLKGEPIRLHKEFMGTECSNIDTAKVRAFADKFASGELDPATGKPPVVTEPEPTMVEVPRDSLESMRDSITEWLG
jgi:peptidoglycan hydrolase-like protein with peptidoglycan-binding domain